MRYHSACFFCLTSHIEDSTVQLRGANRVTATYLVHNMQTVETVRSVCVAVQITLLTLMKATQLVSVMTLAFYQLDTHTFTSLAKQR
jgi:hypothetical protein